MATKLPAKIWRRETQALSRHDNLASDARKGVYTQKGRVVLGNYEYPAGLLCNFAADALIEGLEHWERS